MTPPHGRPVLFHVASRTQWSLLGRVADRLTAAGARTAVSYHGHDPRAWGDPVGGAVLGSADFVDLEAIEASIPAGSLTPLLERKVPPRWQDRLVGDARYRLFLDQHRTKLEAARRAVARLEPRLLIVAEDGVGGNAWLIRATQERGVRVMVVPYGIGGSKDFDNALLQKQRSGDLVLAEGELGERVKRQSPQWVRATPWGPALLFPPDYILAREKVGLRLRNPWAVHGGTAERIAVESPAMHAHYRREGLPEKKLTLTGTVYCDVLHDSLGADARFRAAFERASRIDPGKTRILVALPPSYHGERAQESEFASFALLCRETLLFLKSLPNARVTVSIHPSTLAADRQAIEATGVAVSNGYVLELLAQHDLYVTCFSSTIRWAIACRKPVVNYDMYKFRLDDFKGVPAVITIEEHAELREAMRRLVTEPKHFAAVAEQQRVASADWGTVDGRNFERIHRLIGELAR